MDLFQLIDNKILNTIASEGFFPIKVLKTEMYETLHKDLYGISIRKLFVCENDFYAKKSPQVNIASLP